jgi:heavy metal sensor kinase
MIALSPARWWRSRSVRLKLSVWYMAAMLVVLVAYGGCLLLVIHRTNSRGLDERLRGDFRWATEMAEQRPDGSLTWFETSAVDEDLPWLQVWSPAGQLLFKTAAVARMPIPQSGALAARADNSVAVIRRQVPVRVLSGPSHVGGQPVVIQVARSESAIWADLNDMAVLLLVSLPVAVAMAGGVGYWLARRALDPVGLIADRAHRVTAERLSDRLTSDNPDDELGRLTSVINDMLRRLELSFTQMRRFTANVSHQVRTPLAALRSEAEVALRSPRTGDQYRGTLASMLEEVDRLRGLVDQLLALSRAESGQATLSLEDVDLELLARQVAGHLGVLAEEKRQTITIQCDATPHCVADRSMLRQALINLLDNAVKYTPEGGAITLHLEATSSDGILEVTDTGRGIAAESLERIFDRFYRDAPDTAGDAGFGMGLAIARWAIEVNGGRLTVRPNPAGGSTFRMELPMARAA